MTILMLIPDFGKGGAERVFAQLSSELAKHHRVIDCVFNRFQTCEYGSGNEVVDLNVPSGTNWIQKACYFWLRVYRLRKIKRKYSVTLSISHLEGADYVNALSCIHDKIIFCVHGTKTHDKNIKGVLGWLRLKIFLPVLYRRASHIVSVSRVIRHELITDFGLPAEKITVINNFVDLNTIEMMAKEPLPVDYSSLMRTYDVIISAGRLVPEKNHRLLVRLMPFLLQKRPSVKLIILGAGILHDALKVQAEEAGLRVQISNKSFDSENQVFFAGFCKNPFAYFRHAKAFLLPSLWEGFPLVLCEALTCKIPLVVHDCPTGPREIIAPELTDDATLHNIMYTDYGILIPYSEKINHEVLERWSAAVLTVLSDEAIRNGFVVNGPQRARSFSKERVFEEWTNLIANYEEESV